MPRGSACLTGISDGRSIARRNSITFHLTDQTSISPFLSVRLRCATRICYHKLDVCTRVPKQYRLTALNYCPRSRLSCTRISPIYDVYGISLSWTENSNLFCLDKKKSTLSPLIKFATAPGSRTGIYRQFCRAHYLYYAFIQYVRSYILPAPLPTPFYPSLG